MSHKLIYNVDPTHRFKEFFSAKGFSTKDEYKEARNGCMAFRTSDDSITMNLKRLSSLISAGHEFRSVTGKNSRSQRSFLYSYIIPVDIDESNISLVQFLDDLNAKYTDLVPSIAYETFSNNEGNYRFRLLYVFNEGLKTRKFKSYYKYIVNELNKAFPNILPDSAFLSPVHSFLGTSKDSYVFNSNKIFYTLIDVETYNICILSSLNFTPNGNKPINIEDELLMHKLFNISIDDLLDAEDEWKAQTFNSDLYIKEQYVNSPELKALMDETCGKNALSPVEFINKHKDEYEIIEHTTVEFGDKTMLVRPEDYYDLDWLRLHNGFGKNSRRKDGQRRKTTLGVVAIYLRMIKPNITPAEMYYNLVNERLNYYNNEDMTINNHFLRTIIKATFLLEPDEIQIREANINVKKPMYIIDVKRRKSIGAVPGHKPTFKAKWDTSLIDWTKSCKENFLKIKESFPELKESTFRKYYSVNRLK